MKPNNFLRLHGVTKQHFDFILELLTEYVEDCCYKLKGGISLENRLKLTFRYLRSYPTFLELGQEFGISDSYANKVFHKIMKILPIILRLPNFNNLQDLGNLVIDVTEQETERPKKNNI
jgi:hypothetical protein